MIVLFGIPKCKNVHKYHRPLLAIGQGLYSGHSLAAYRYTFIRSWAARGENVGLCILHIPVLLKSPCTATYAAFQSRV